jgi:multidrug resistance efflux pump
MNRATIADERLRSIRVPHSVLRREFRMRYLSGFVFIFGVGVAAILWREVGEGGQLAGIGEGIRASVINPRYGIVQQILVQPYQIVEKGEVIAVILPTDPMAKINLLQTELEIARVRLMPTLSENNALDYERLRMEFLRTKTELAAARVNLARAESDVHRNAPLAEEKLVSEDVYELSISMRDLYRTEVEQKSNVVEDVELRLEQLKAFGLSQPSQTNDLKSTIANRLEQAYNEAITNWNQVIVRAPISGMIQFVNKQEGELSIEGEILVSLNSLWSDRVISYLRQPFFVEPKIGAKVTITTRDRTRKTVVSEIIQIGAHYDVITNSLAYLRQGAIVDAGLPIVVRLPANVQIHPGEMVDLRLEGSTGSETWMQKTASKLLFPETEANR